MNILATALPALELLHGDTDDVFEVRILAPGKTGKRIWHGYFTDAESAYGALSDFDVEWSAAYVTLHAVKPEKLLIANGFFIRGSDKEGAGTTNEDILKRKWIVVDVDPIREPKEQPSSDSEKAHALEIVRNIALYCQARGMPEPILADSGNGWHLLWRCDIPADSSIHKRMLIELASKFNSPRVDVDLTVSNPGRIWKIYGTFSRKGKATLERPFRFAKVISVPKNSRIITEKDISVWLPSIGNESRVLRYNVDGTSKERRSNVVPTEQQAVIPRRNDGKAEFDAIEKAKNWGLNPLPPKMKGDLKVYELPVCPCGRKLQDRASAIYVMPNGAVSFGCKHESCDYAEENGNHWKALRETFEPKQIALPVEKETISVEPRVSIEKLLERVNNKRERKPTLEVDFNDLDALGPSPFEDDLDLGGILGDLAVNPEVPEKEPDIEIARPVDLSRNIMRAKDGRLMVNIKADFLTIYGQTFEEIVTKDDVYVSQGKLSYVDTEKGSMTPYEDGGLDRLAWRCCEYVEFKRTASGYGTKPSAVPKRVIEALKDLDHQDRTFLREVTQVVKSPFFTEAGEFVTATGYNEPSKTYMIECPTLSPVGSVDDALRYLRNIIADFPFQTNAERANFLGTWLTPMVRTMIRGPVPMTVIEANKRGTGKTKLAQVVQSTYGLNPEVGDLPKEEQDMEKLMLSIIVEGRPIHLFDNVKHNVNSACLDRVLTTGYYSGRLLGKTKNLHCLVHQLFIMTSNNTRMSEDMSRRFVRVRLKTDLRNPERRTDVRNPNLLPWISDNRGTILACLARLVVHWIDCGRPLPKSIPLLGSYESWRSVVGGVLWCAGETDWMKNLDEAMADSQILDEWDAFTHQWYITYGVKAYLKNLVALCEDKGILGNIVRGDPGQRQYALRQALIDRRDSIIGDFRLSIVRDSHTKTDSYVLTKIAAPATEMFDDEEV